MNQKKKINVGSYIKVIRGTMSGEVYKVFYMSSSGTFAGVGIENSTDVVLDKQRQNDFINEFIIVSEDTFNKVNQDKLLQDELFF